MVYSFSQVQVFAKCPRKYQYQYIDKMEKEFEASLDTILGNSVHATLERLYNQVNVFKIPSLEDLQAQFFVKWDKEYAQASKGKSLPMKNENSLEDYQRRGQKYLESYYSKYAPFSHAKIIDTEMQIIFQLDKDKKFRGFIDRLDKEDDDTFVINDYKTNKKLPPEEKEEYTQQLTLYGLAIKQKYGKYLKKIKARLYYLHFDIVDEREITDTALSTIVEKYVALINAIEHKKFAYNMGDKKAFPPVQNNLCKYCEYQSTCPLRAHLKYDDEVVSSELGEKTISSLIDEYFDLSKQEQEYSKKKEVIKEILIEYAQAKSLSKLFGKKAKISLSEIETISLKDKEALKNVLQTLNLWDDAVEIDRFKIQKLLKDGMLDFEKIKEYIEKKISVRVRGSLLKEEE